MLNTGLRQALLLGGVLIAGAFSALSGCSNDTDTVIALNIKLEKVPEGLTTLGVTITQAGQAPLTTDIAPPTLEVDGGTTFKESFYERILLPEAWQAAPAQVRVDAKNAAGTTLASAEAEAAIREDGAVAVYVTFPADPEPDAGVDAGM